MSVDSPTIQQSLCLANCGVSALRSRRYVVERYARNVLNGQNSNLRFATINPRESKCVNTAALLGTYKLDVSRPQWSGVRG